IPVLYFVAPTATPNLQTMLGEQIEDRFGHAQPWIREGRMAFDVTDAGRRTDRKHRPASIAPQVRILLGIDVDREPVGVDRKRVPALDRAMIESGGVVV